MFKNDVEFGKRRRGFATASEAVQQDWIDILRGADKLALVTVRFLLITGFFRRAHRRQARQARWKTRIGSGRLRRRRAAVQQV